MSPSSNKRPVLKSGIHPDCDAFARAFADADGAGVSRWPTASRCTLRSSPVNTKYSVPGMGAKCCCTISWNAVSKYVDSQCSSRASAADRDDGSSLGSSSPISDMMENSGDRSTPMPNSTHCFNKSATSGTPTSTSSANSQQRVGGRTGGVPVDSGVTCGVTLGVSTSGTVSGVTPVADADVVVVVIVPAALTPATPGAAPSTGASADVFTAAATPLAAAVRLITLPCSAMARGGDGRCRVACTFCFRSARYATRRRFCVCSSTRPLWKRRMPAAAAADSTVADGSTTGRLDSGTWMTAGAGALGR